MSIPVGRSLELAIGRASKVYRAGGRKCVMVRQHTPFTIVNGRRVYQSVGAPCDFIGAVDAAPFAAEAKETQHTRFDLDKRRVSQWSALSLLRMNGYEVRLIVDFYELGETYTVKWTYVEAFLSAPHRKSLPIYWFRAFGELVRETERNTAHRTTLFLDSRPHPERETAYLAWTAERAKAAGVVVSFDDETGDEVRPQVASSRPNKATDPEGYARHIGALMQQGTERQLGSKKKKTFGRRGRG